MFFLKNGGEEKQTMTFCDSGFAASSKQSLKMSNFPSASRQGELLRASLAEVREEGCVRGDWGRSRRRGRGQEGITQSVF